MEFSKLELYFLMIFLIIYIEAGLNLEKDNVCLKTIKYNETTTLVLHRPESKKNTATCLKEGKNCDEVSIVKAPRVIVRTKIVPSCCEGYEEDPGGTQCVPICPKGCGNGKCVAPGKCSCEAGFSGPECGQICDEFRWGENCFFECNCSENEFCDKISGCTCKLGWMGDRCATPCPEGYYGFLCNEKCPCDFNLCDHVTGTCVKPKETFKTHLVEDEGSETTDKLIKSEDFEISETDISTSTLESEIFDENVVATIIEKHEVSTTNPGYFKSEKIEDERNSEQSMEMQNSFPPETKSFKSVENVNSTIFRGSGNAKRLDFLQEFTSLNVSRNEILNADSDRRMTNTGNEQSARSGNFIPTFTVLSSVTVLIILIAGRWLAISLQKKIKKMANNVELDCPDEELGILSPEKFLSEYTFDNSVYAAEILKAVPTLQTFKPQTAETESDLLKKKIRLVAE